MKIFKHSIRLALSLAVALLAGHPADADERWGKIHFPTSCSPDAQQTFEQAVAMLYSFSFLEAAKTFTAVAQRDPSCAMAYWGLAATKMGSLFGGRVRPNALQEGSAAVEKAEVLEAKTTRERDYIAVAKVFYKDADKIDQATRTRAYANALAELHRKYPDDLEAEVLFAYALTAQASPADLTYKYQLQGAAILERLREKHPEHPGITHYLIHAYDYAPLAARGLSAARRYADIAPAAPHAQQFPAHIYVRLGLWQNSIKTNIAGAAVEDQFFKFHAEDFLAFSYLQTGQDVDAKQVLDDVADLKKIKVEQLITAYALAALPARYAVERRNWVEAAALVLPRDDFPWGRFPQAEAALVFARALGAARIGNFDAAERDLGRLHELRNSLIKTSDEGIFQSYWIGQIEINNQMVVASVAFAKGKQEEALQMLRVAADREDSTECDPVVPGSIVSARELLGELLLKANQPQQALDAFEASLKVEPGRIWGLYGAGQAAQLLGDRPKAKKFYSQLVAQTQQASNDREILKLVKAYLGKG